jgi:hypothetical protein
MCCFISLNSFLSRKTDRNFILDFNHFEYFFKQPKDRTSIRAKLLKDEKWHQNQGDQIGRNFAIWAIF